MCKKLLVTNINKKYDVKRDVMKKAYYKRACLN